MPNNSKDNNKAKPNKIQRKKKRNAKNIEGKRPQVKKTKKGNKKKKSHPKLMMLLKIAIIIFLLLSVIGAGIIAGIFFGLFGDDFEISSKELTSGAANSVLVASNGEVIENISGDEKRKPISLDEMADYLPKAYVAIEDERFYKHSGVDFKRTAGAIVTTLIGKNTYGGSTITQQLVKNITKDDESTGMAGIFRKVKEWAKAYQVERMISKNQILELYLNILFVGGEGNLHGVELGAEYYFNKSAKDLSLAECAYLAGINSRPTYYNPYKLASDTDTEEKRAERIKSKILTVLAKMKELGYIPNEEEYNQAVEQANAGLKFEKGQISTGNNYSYHTDAVIKQVIEQFMEEKGWSWEMAANYVYSGGLTIYSTVNPEIQARVEEETKKAKYIKPGHEKNKDGTLVNAQTQAAMVIIDNKTGYVLGVSGGLGEKAVSGLNRGTQSKRQPGSSIKPIADIAPALQEKVITAATMYNDVLTDFGGGYKPKNEETYLGNINIRTILAKSQNVPEVKIMRELTPSKSIDYLRNFGVTTLKKSNEVESNVPNDEHLSLAIGGISEGISPLEMAAAYAAIANKGEYIEPTFYTKVVDANGDTVLTPTQEKKRVITEQNAYITSTIMQGTVQAGGTAPYCAIPGMDVGAKTGTTDGHKDRWLCGFTPYYSAACWFGYDTPEEVVQREYSANPAALIWSSVMKDIHKGLASATFTRPSGIVEQKVCSLTGGLATAECPSYTEIFTSDNLPEKCQGHGNQAICSETNKIATEYCSQYVTVTNKPYGGTLPKEQLNLWKPVNGATVTGAGKIEETCNVHTKPKEVEKPPEPPKTNTSTNTNNTNTNPSGSGDTTSGGSGTGDSTSGGNSGGSSTGGSETGGGNTGGDNTGGSETGDGNTGGDNTGGNRYRRKFKRKK